MDVPFAYVNIAPKTGCKSVGNPGYGNVFNSTAFSFFGASISIKLFPASMLQPVSLNLCIIGVSCSGITLFILAFPPVTATAHKKVPASILSGIIL